MSLSKKISVKQQTIDALVKHYGAHWKTPLAKELGVNLSTVRRIFNQSKEIPLRYQQAIENILHE